MILNNTHNHTAAYSPHFWLKMQLSTIGCWNGLYEFGSYYQASNEKR